MMIFKQSGLFGLLLMFSSYSFATNVDEWEYELIKGNLKPTAGCRDKDVAAKKASTGYRFKKYTAELCTTKGYGWGKESVEDNGKLVCEACEGEYDGAEKYRCYMKDVIVKCKKVRTSW